MGGGGGFFRFVERMAVSGLNQNGYSSDPFINVLKFPMKILTVLTVELSDPPGPTISINKQSIVKTTTSCSRQQCNMFV